MKDKMTYLEMSDGTKYPLIFTLNVMESIQDEYGSLDKWMELIKEGEPNIKALKFGLGEMLNEGLEIENETAETKRELLDSKKVGRIITELGMSAVAGKIGENVVASTKTDAISKNV